MDMDENKNEEDYTYVQRIMIYSFIFSRLFISVICYKLKGDLVEIG